MKALIKIRLKSIRSSLSNSFKGKKKGTMILLGILLVYGLCAVEFMMIGVFSQLSVMCTSNPELSWFYFSTAGLLSMLIAIVGNVFMTQNQLYDAKDNEMLLSLPVKPSQILFSRMAALIIWCAVFSALVMAPAIAVYQVKCGFKAVSLLFSIIAYLCSVLFSQSICCVFGFLLHLIIKKSKNKAVASMIYLILFFVVYFFVVFRAEWILNSFMNNLGLISKTFYNWMWPIYAMGSACIGKPLLLVTFVAICAAVFGTVWLFLSLTFNITVKSSKHASGVRGKAFYGQNTVIGTIRRKEMKRFFTSTVYFTNFGLGIIMMIAVVVVGIVMRAKLLTTVNDIGFQSYLPVVVIAGLGFMISMTCISAPSVSLEGKSFWIIKSTPVTEREIILGKLSFHCIATLPVTAVCAIVISIVYGFSPLTVILVTLLCTLLSLLCGILGLVLNIAYPRFDWINEAGPCKQSASVGVTMIAMMGFIIAALVITVVLTAFLSSVILGLTGSCLFVGIITFLFWILLSGWGERKLRSLEG